MIEHITYKNKKYPVRVSYSTLKGFKAETGISFDDVSNGSEKMEMEYYEPILFYALKAGALAEDVEMPFKREEMEGVLDECFMEFVNLIPKFFPDAEVGKHQPNRAERRLQQKGGK